MDKVDKNKNIHISRGDDISLQVVFNSNKFKAGDVVNLLISPVDEFDAAEIVATKTVENDNTKSVLLTLEGWATETFVYEARNEIVTLYYDVQLTRGTEKFNILGYDNDGPRKIYVYPKAIERGYSLNIV